MPQSNASSKPVAGRSETRSVQSVEVGARLLYALTEETEPMMLKDLAKLAGLAPAQAHAYLVSYRRIGLVEKDPDSGRYRLGRFALDLGTTRMRSCDPMVRASETVTFLSRETMLNAALIVWGSYGPTVVQLVESGTQVNMNTRPGTVYSLTGTASGRAFAAFMPEKTIKESIANEKREGANSPRVGAQRFLPRAELQEIREAGYASVEDPPVPGISAFAAPVLDYTGQLLFVITLIGEDHHILPLAESDYLPALLKATSELSAELGYRPFGNQI